MPADPTRQAPDPAVVRGLLERVTAATGPDREIDGAIMAAFDPPEAQGYEEPFAYFCRFNGDGFGIFKPHAATPAGLGVSVPTYTASLDAALELAELVLPNFSWSVGRQGGRFRAALTETSPLRPIPVIAKAGVTGGLVLVKALLLVHLQGSEAHAD